MNNIKLINGDNMTKDRFNKRLKQTKEFLPILKKNFEYLSDDDKNEIEQALLIIVKMGQKYIISEFDRTV